MLILRVGREFLSTLSAALIILKARFRYRSNILNLIVMTVMVLYFSYLLNAAKGDIVYNSLRVILLLSVYGIISQAFNMYNVVGAARDTFLPINNGVVRHVAAFCLSWVILNYIQAFATYLALIAYTRSLGILSLLGFIAILVLATIASLGLSFMIAGVGMLLQNVRFILSILNVAALGLSGIIINLSRVPMMFRIAALLFPHTLYINLADFIVFGKNAIIDAPLEFLVATVFALVIFYAGLLVMNKCCKYVMSKGLIMRV